LKRKRSQTLLIKGTISNQLDHTFQGSKEEASVETLEIQWKLSTTGEPVAFGILMYKCKMFSEQLGTEEMAEVF